MFIGLYSMPQLIIWRKFDFDNDLSILYINEKLDSITSFHIPYFLVFHIALIYLFFSPFSQEQLKNRGLQIQKKRRMHTYIYENKNELHISVRQMKRS